MEIRADVDLQSLNTLAVPSRATWYCELKALEDLTSAASWAKRQSFPIAVLAGGSNVLLPEVLPGLTVHVAFSGIEILARDSQTVTLRVAAGENWHSFVSTCVQAGYSGLENLALIPGTVGAAPIQNIGAYGIEVERFVVRVEWFEFASGQVRTLDHRECQFAYRDSIFKNALAGKGVVTYVTFRLPTVFQAALGYPGLSETFRSLYADAPPDGQKVFHSVCHLRVHKLPDPAQVPNCGSFFKNPIIDAQHFAVVASRYSAIPGFEQRDGRVKVPAAWLIDQAGFKQVSHMSVTVHQQQALVVVNPARQPISVVLEYADKISARVAEMFGIELEREPQLLVS